MDEEIVRILGSGQTRDGALARSLGGFRPTPTFIAIAFVNHATRLGRESASVRLRRLILSLALNHNADILIGTQTAVLAFLAVI